MHLIATLEDDFFGIRAKGNKVKTLRARKEDREGHPADAIADAFFRVVLGVRFRRIGEPHLDSVAKLMNTILDDKGEEALNGCVFNADRGYQKESILQILSVQGLSSILVMIEHLVRCQPFAEESYFNVFRSDE